MDDLSEIFGKLAVQSDLSYFKKRIDTNEYITNCSSNKKKSVHSFSYLIDLELSQSDCIKAGQCFEHLIHDTVLEMNVHLDDIKEKNSKGIKEKDFLFKNES